MTPPSEHYSRLYDQLWDSELREGREAMGDLELSLSFLRKTNLLDKQISILDIGCGIGQLCNRLYQMDSHSAIGIDISSTALSYGRNKFPSTTLVQMDATRLGFADQSFDICLSFDLVEHVTDLDLHLSEAWRVLKPGGKYLFQTPNIISSSIVECIRHKSWSARKLYHPSLQSSWALRKKFLRAGFTNVEFDKMAPLSDIKLREVPTFARWAFRHVPWQSLPMWLQTNFYGVAHR